MNEKEKLLQYIDYKGITRNAFCKLIGAANGFFDQGRSMHVDKVKTIIETFPDISLEWLVLDRGPMIVDPEAIVSKAISSVTEANGKVVKMLDLVASQQETIASQQKLIAEMQLRLDKKGAQHRTVHGADSK